MNNRLWMKQPASDWLEGFPIGTGRLAAMVPGYVRQERLGLNHEWLWQGRNRYRDNTPRAHLLAGVRELLWQERWEEAAQAANDAFGGLGGISGQPNRVDPYQPAGDLCLEFPHGPHSDYRRELDLETGIVEVSYQALSLGRVTRTYVADLVRDALYVRLWAQGKPFDCALWLDRQHDPGCELTYVVAPAELNLGGAVAGGTGFHVRCRVSHRAGALQAAALGKLAARGVTELILAVDVGTTVNYVDPAAECRAEALPPEQWENLVREHTARYRQRRSGFQLSLSGLPDREHLTTPERIERVRQGEDDPGLALLYFNHARHLMIGSSANAQLPANLQGKWNEDLTPPWDADYHHDVNLQMCYWFANPTGMTECLEALFQHIERFVPHARQAARDLYGCRGVWYPIQSDAWGRATPESYGWAVWIGAAAWLAQHFWLHYDFTRDHDFLAQRAYPFLKEVAAFYEDYLVANESGILQALPSQSPENRFVGSGDRFPVSLGVSAAMDVQLAWDTLTHAAQAAAALGVDEDLRAHWESMVARLPALQVGSHGQLLEWDREFVEAEPGHRHISHLYALYPGDQIDPVATPQLFAAARRSLELRLAHFGGHTGWSRAWTACCFARLGDAEEAYEHLMHLATDFVTGSLLDLHPPRIFQIEGNLGGAAAVVEMLLQSRGGRLELLPALPAAWPNGAVHGLRGRGGFTVDLQWTAGALASATIVAGESGPCRVLCQGQRLTVTGSSGQAVAVTTDGVVTEFQTLAGERYEIHPAG